MTILILELETSAWSDCTVSCGGGTRHRTYSCRNATHELNVNDCGRGLVKNLTMPCKKIPCPGEFPTMKQKYIYTLFITIFSQWKMERVPILCPGKCQYLLWTCHHGNQNLWQSCTSTWGRFLSWRSCHWHWCLSTWWWMPW